MYMQVVFKTDITVRIYVYIYIHIYIYIYIYIYICMYYMIISTVKTRYEENTVNFSL